MSILSTDIQAALGETGPLDYAMLDRAVKANLSETQRLDWKRDPYEPTDKKGPAEVRDEFCKDVAALANAQGGILVIGVAESGGTAHALAPLNPSDNLQRKFRSWLHARVSPGVPGVQMTPILDPNDGTRGALVVSVPASPEAPHLVGDEKGIRYPLRDGTQTKWLAEHEIERAYADRLNRRRSEDQALADMADQASLQLDASVGCWLIAAARPSLPLPRTAPPLTRDQVRSIGQSAQASVRSIAVDAPLNPRDMDLFASFGDGLLNPRIGLRKWIFETYRETHDAVADTLHAEIHDDGSCLIAMRGGNHHEQKQQAPTDIPDWVLGTVALAVVALARAVTEARGLDGSQFIRVSARHNEPLSIVQPERIGPITVGAGTPRWSRQVRRLQPVETAVTLTQPAGSLESAFDLVRQLAAQFGIDSSEFGWSNDKVAGRVEAASQHGAVEHQEDEGAQ